MKKSIIISLFAALVGMMSFTSCLDTESNRFVDASSELTQQDSVFRMLGILNGVKKLAGRYVLLGELRGDLMKTTNYAPDDLRELDKLDISSTNSYVTQKEYYSIINQCNYIIVKGAALPKEQAVARIFRAWTYMQLALNYGKCQYYENIIDSKESAKASYPEYNIQELASVLIPQLEAVYSDFNLDLRWPSYGSVGTATLLSQMIDYRFVLADLYMWSATPGETSKYLRAAQLYAELIKSRAEDYATSYAISATPFVGSSQTTGTDAYGNSFTGGLKSYKYETNTPYDWYGLNVGRTSSSEMINYIYIPSSTDSAKITSNIDSLTGYPKFEKKDIAVNATSRAAALWSGTKYAFVTGTSNTCDESDYAKKPFLKYLTPSKPTYDLTGDLRVNSSYGMAVVNNSGSYSLTDSTILKYINTKAVTLVRTGQLYLRWATAMTAAGKPNLAMVALKYGLNDFNIMLYGPTYEKPDMASITTSNNEVYRKYRTLIWDNSSNAKTGQSFLQNTGSVTTKWWYYLPEDSVKKYNYKLPMRAVVTYAEDGVTVKSTSFRINAASDTIFYAFNDTIQSSYDFSNSKYGVNAGLHSRGAGCAAADTTFKMPYDVYPIAATASDAYKTAQIEKQMTYMYDIICRESALDMAFEGNRFQDLMMFSRLTGSPSFLANWLKYKNASFATTLAVPGDLGWDSKSWYLPKSSKETFK